MKDDGSFLNTSGEITKEVHRYYNSLYKETKEIDEIANAMQGYARNLTFPKVSEQDKAKTEEELTETELSSALRTMKNGSAPRPDGIPVEFHKTFWPDVKFLFMNSLHYSHTIGILSPTQRHGTISLIHKGKDLVKDKLTNWRPISLTNADYKIISKALALRLGNVLPKIINQNQAGFVKGRKMSELIREMDDIIETEKLNPTSESLALSIDYSKTFDSISTVTIIDALKLFYLGEYFVSWVSVILNGRTANVKNGGLLCEPFALERGVRQGCPVSPMLFIIGVEILALKIRQGNQIKGITLPNSPKSIRILQYADDTTLFLRNRTDLREVLSEIKKFSFVSGLNLNENKSTILQIGKNQVLETYLENIECREKIKILGVTFSSKSPAGELKDNWENIVENIERTLSAWSKRDLSLIGKKLILKTSALSKLNHLIESIGLPNTVLKHLNTMFFRFLWKKRYYNKRAFEKIKRKVMYNPTEKGGLKILNIEAIQSAAYLHWAEKLLTGVEQDWKILPKAAYKNVGFSSVFASTVKSIWGIKSLETSTMLNNNNDTKVKLTQPIFNNKLLIYQGTPLFNKQCILSNIL